MRKSISSVITVSLILGMVAPQLVTQQEAKASGDIIVMDFEEMLVSSGSGIEGVDFSEKNYSGLEVFVEDLLTKYKEKKKSSDLDSDDYSDAKKQISLVGFAAETLAKSSDKNRDSREKRSAFARAKRMLYSAVSIDEVAEQAAKGKKSSKVKKLFMILKRKKSRVQYASDSVMRRGISREQAIKESQYLIDPNGNPTRFLSITELTGKSPKVIANYDVSPTHPVWHTRKYMNSLDSSSKDAWIEQETWINSQVRNILPKARKKLAKAKIKEREKLQEKLIKIESQWQGLPEYDLLSAKRVLFFSKVKTTATSPKIVTKDIYGMKWKLKWGNEVHSEPISNRLYKSMGAKFVDLVYVNQYGPEGTVLILDKKGSGIDTVDKLKSAMLSSSYNFALAPYILEEASGVITSENKDLVLKNIPSSRRDQYVGREFATFNESMVEFTGNKIYTRGGPIANSTVGAQNDRTRGLVVFNMWIGNVDAKDENSKSYILKNYLGVKGKQYLETQHDLGSSLGKVSAIKGGTLPADINRFAAQGVVSIDPYSYEVTFNQGMMYKPDTWEIPTPSDLLWGARQVAEIPLSRIRSAVATTLWPDFVQEAMIYHLNSRRVEIASAFGISLDSSQMMAAPQVDVDLSSRRSREVLAAKLNFDVNQLDKRLVRAGVMGRIGDDTERQYIEDLVIDGDVVGCSDSILIGLLEATTHPAGLSRRIPRTADNEPLSQKKCKGSPEKVNSSRSIWDDIFQMPLID